jgi:hypothetical protein
MNGGDLAWQTGLINRYANREVVAFKGHWRLEQNEGFMRLRPVFFDLQSFHPYTLGAM